MTYGNEIKSFRLSMNLSQSQLAKATGISQQAISFWEQNKRTPNMDDCIILADFFGITLDELVGRDAIPTQNSAKTYNNYGTHNGNVKF